MALYICTIKTHKTMTTTNTTATVNITKLNDRAEYSTALGSFMVYLCKSDAWHNPSTKCSGAILHHDGLTFGGHRVWINVSENHPIFDVLMSNGWQLGWDAECIYS